MQYRLMNHPSIDLSEHPSKETFDLIVTEATIEPLEVGSAKSVHFQTCFEGCMEMYSDEQTVAEYLNTHERWFCRCAQPMKVEPIGNNGYILVIGRFGSFGYEVEPKIAVVLMPPQDGVYWMQSIPVPDYHPPGYAVNYQASMKLIEIPAPLAASDITTTYQKQGKSKCPSVITQVRWQLNLDVAVQFPEFIDKLPLSLIQCTGDRLLAQIVCQISPRLTAKVQQDFHTSLNLPMPPKSSRQLWKIKLLTPLQKS